MTGKQLILDILNGKEAERTPWVPYTGVQISSLKGYTAEEMLKDGDKLFECLMESNMQYSPDGQPVVFDLQIEAEALGCNLLWAEKAPPTVCDHPLESNKEINFHIPSKDEGRTPLILDAMKRFKAAVGERTALYGLVCGPFTLASHLRGTNIFMDMYDDPAYVKRLLAEFPGRVEVIERKITEAENIARLGKMGIANLPTIAINGKVKYISVIPNKEELKASVAESLT